MPKNVIITGTSSGLGKSLAVTLAQKGYKVYATMRNLDKCSDLEEAARQAGVKVEILQLDVQAMASVEACVAKVVKKDKKIDVLINNAGAGYVRTTEQADLEDIQWVMDVNFMGVVRCIKAVLPHMRKAKRGRILNITSVGGLVGQPFNELYCAAKFAVEGYTESMATYIQPSFGIKFTAVEPGGIASEFAKSALKQFEGSGGMQDDEYRPLLEKYIGGAQKRSASLKEIYQTADEVAAVVIGCVESKEPPVRIRTSAWAESFCELKTGRDPDGKKLQDQVYKTFLG